MNRKTKVEFITGGILLVLFVFFTLSLSIVDIGNIGPGGAPVAYASLNKAVHNFFGVNMMLYNITDWAGLVAICISLGFAVLGLVQLVKRKSILKVDSSILILGVFYILVFSLYIFFEFHVINRRPILINGFLEASYPSSTTMLTMCILPTAILQFRKRIQKHMIRKIVNTLCGLFTVCMVFGRLLSGVHWFTDILGAGVFSIAMVLLYCAANHYMEGKK